MVYLFRLLPPLALLLATAAVAAPSSQCYNGYAYNTDNNRLAFTAHYQPTGDEGELLKQWRVTYRDADNGLIATKQMDFTQNSFVPVFTLRFANSQDTIGIRRDAEGHWQMFKGAGADNEVQNEAFEIEPLMAGDNGIHPFIQAHFAKLMAQEPVKFKLVVPPRQSVVKMRIDRIEDTQIDGRRAVRFRVKVNSFFISWFTQKLIFTYLPQNKQLLAYSGVSDMQRNRGEAFPIRMRYYRNGQPADAPELPACTSGP